MAARKCFSNLCSAVIPGFYFFPRAIRGARVREFLNCFVHKCGTRMPRLFLGGSMFTLRRFALFVFLLLALTGLAVGQTQITTGVIQGTVFDPSGAVLPGADVTATNVSTQAETAQKTDGDGRFVFLSLSPGRYSVTASKTGFSKLVQKDVELTVGQALNLRMALKVSAT